MRWKQLFTPVENLNAEELRKYMADHAAEAYTLLDVRQPKEYEQSHIPGARLIPVGQLSDRLDEIPRDKPTLVYCAVGGRSRAAAQLLSGKGFATVYNLKGGIKAWDGQTAVTPVDLKELALSGHETPPDVIILIYAMEAGLETFYDEASKKVPDDNVKKLLANLAKIEDRHKAKLRDLFEAMNPTARDIERFEAAAASKIMEGGFDMAAFLSDNMTAMQSAAGVLDIAMMLEVHGLDLYLRYAQEMEGRQESRKVLLDLAEEEKAHLKSLGELLESI